VKKKPKPKEKLKNFQKKPKEDCNQAAFRVVQETIRRTEGK